MFWGMVCPEIQEIQLFMILKLFVCYIKRLHVIRSKIFKKCGSRYWTIVTYIVRQLILKNVFLLREVELVTQVSDYFSESIYYNAKTKFINTGTFINYQAKENNALVSGNAGDKKIFTPVTAKIMFYQFN